MSRAVSAARHALQNVSAIPTSAGQRRAGFAPPALLSFRYQPFPQPINCTTLVRTTDIAADPYHPLCIRTQRRLANFDAEKLHLRVVCPLPVSKKAFIRGWATSRVKRAFAKCLRQNGWDESGNVRHDASGLNERLGGALLLILTPSELALTASKEEMQETVAWVLKRVLALREAALQPGRPIESRLQRAKPVSRDSWRTPRHHQEAQSDEDEIRTQVEYYFSDASLPFDRFLLAKVGARANRAVPLSIICAFNKMKHYRPRSAILDAVSRSDAVELVVMEDGANGIRRRVPMDDWVTEDVEKNIQRAGQAFILGSQ